MKLSYGFETEDKEEVTGGGRGERSSPESVYSRYEYIGGGAGGRQPPALTWGGRGELPDERPDHPRLEIRGAKSLIDGEVGDSAVDFAGRGAIERGVRPSFVVELKEPSEVAMRVEQRKVAPQVNLIVLHGAP